MTEEEQDYEAVRLENIRKNAELLLSLGLDKTGIRLRSPSPERKSVVRKQRAASETASEASTSLQPVRKSSRIASHPRLSYAPSPRPKLAGTPKSEHQRIPREGTRKSSRTLARSSGKYKEWDSDDEDDEDDEHIARGTSSAYRGRLKGSDDDDNDVDGGEEVFSLSYREKRNGSETFVELESSPAPQLRKLKNPLLPTPPPSNGNGDGDGVGISSVRAPLPSREVLPDGMGKGALVFEERFRHFRPNVTPEEMLRGGIFGGTAFRPFYSSVLQRDLDVEAELSELPPSWLEGLDLDRMVRSATPDPSLNRFGVKVGESLERWEQLGWIRAQDPRGWFQWYYRFFLGRRSDDDERQVRRWLKACGPGGKFKKGLVRRVAFAGGAWDDETINATVRQTLWQWGYELTQDDYRAYLSD
ncbi:hypothetical protein ACQY0O_000269 [Thecaphora frezii]